MFLVPAIMIAFISFMINYITSVITLQNKKLLNPTRAGIIEVIHVIFFLVINIMAFHQH